MKEINLFVITGGPGVGKTTLLNALQKQGFCVVTEEARRIIQEQIQTGGDGLPWKNKRHYAQLMLDASLETYQRIINQTTTGTVFFDRGILDTICYSLALSHHRRFTIDEAQVVCARCDLLSNSDVA